MSNSFDIDYESIVNHLGVPPNDGLNYHIFPLSAFNLLDPIDFAIATCPENHQ